MLHDGTAGTTFQPSSPEAAPYDGADVVWAERRHRAPGRQVRVLVVDDMELVQAGVRALLGAQEWIGTCVGSTSGPAALECVRRYRPHVALVELSVGGLNGLGGLELSRTLVAAAPHLRVMLMSENGRVSPAMAAAYGARGFLPKQAPAAAIVDAVRRLSEGALVFPRNGRPLLSTQLSPREQEVLQQLVRGLSNPEVARALHLSRHTVKQHTSTVYRKLGVRNRAEAASRARELGLVA
jgi:DNA-binding NarL/FixJ family response regulator